MWTKQLRDAACEVARRRYPGQGRGEWHALNESVCSVRLMGGEQFITRAEAEAEARREQEV